MLIFVFFFEVLCMLFVWCLVVCWVLCVLCWVFMFVVMFVGLFVLMFVIGCKVLIDFVFVIFGDCVLVEVYVVECIVFGFDKLFVM